MRVWGKLKNTDGTYKWVAYGDNLPGGRDMAYFIWLQNVLLLVVGEDPFNPDWGGWSFKSMAQAIWPDYYMQLTQQRMAPYFSSLAITRGTAPDSVTAAYNVQASMLNGTASSITLSNANSQDGFA